MTWFFTFFWFYWDWKTQNLVWYLLNHTKKSINITNFYTWYTDFQISSYKDIINILDDIYEYHKFVILFKYQEKLHKFKPKEDFEKYKNDFLEFLKKYNITYDEFVRISKDIKFNVCIDEASIYFNPRDYAKNFAWENSPLNKYIFQPRKLNLLFIVVCQSPMELDVRFRRLCSTFREYTRWFWFWRWYTDYFFNNPETMDFEKAKVVWWWPVFWGYLSIYPIYPNYDYNTKELIFPDKSIYIKGSIMKKIIKEICKW